MERELDSFDLQLLRAVAVAGEVVPKNIHQQRRLDRLDLEGYVLSACQPTSESATGQPLTYRLTPKGRRAV